MANITKLYLLNVPLENDYKNTLYFTNASSQQSYFQSRIVKSYTDFSYQRKDNIIRIPEEYDEIYNVNYCMYQNSAYSNKWFYAFVTDLRYVNDGMTEAVIETDVMQTWLFDYTIKSSFVEREHVDNDTIGLHTVPENLETGEYVSEGMNTFNYFGSAHIVISATYDVFYNNGEGKEAGSYINGIYSGVDYFLIRGAGNDPQAPSYIDSIKYFLKAYASSTKTTIEAITGMFMVPDELTGYDGITQWDYMQRIDGLDYYAYKKLSGINGTGTVTGEFINRATNVGNNVLTKPYSTVNGYSPRNKKLFTYPYKYLMASNNNGANAIYQYEFFRPIDDEDPATEFSFESYGALTPGCSIRLYPRRYKGIAYAYDEGLPVGKFPICSYNTDMYTNWLTQNGLNLELGIIGGTIQGGISGAMMGGGIGAVIGAGAGLIGGIVNAISQDYTHSMIPPQAEGNLNNGDVTFAMGINTVMFYKMTIRSEYAQIIDKFFDMFGYKVNMVKVPNSAHRSRWWYTKTLGANVDGQLPQSDLDKIRQCYDNGITFWRNASEIENYSLSNGIV